MGQQQVRGTTVDAARRFAERQLGTPRWDALRAALEPHHLVLLDEPIRRRRWYDLESYAGILGIGAPILAPEDPSGFLSDLGRFVMEDGVNTLYRAFFAIASPSFVIKGSALLWGRFFRGSRLKVTGRARSWVSVEIVGAQHCWQPLCVSVGGGMLSALEHAGARDVQLARHHCQANGGDRCQFRFQWR